MRYALLLVVALVGTLSAQNVTFPTSGEWVGALQFKDSRGELIVPTSVTLRVAADGNVEGEWIGNTQARPSGTLTGKLSTAGQIELTVLLFSSGVVGKADGTQETLGPERCRAEAKFSGTLLRTGVFRLASRRAIADTAALRALGRDCEDLTALVWTLQRRDGTPLRTTSAGN